MKRRLHVAILSFWLLAGAACKKESAPAPAAKAQREAVPVPGMKLNPAAILGRLQEEARVRPAAAVKAEAVLDALAREGLTLERRRQYLGATVGASYCLGGTARGGLAVSVCEYRDEAAAAQGRLASLTRFRAPAREIFRNRATTLTVMGASDGTAAQRVGEVFQRL